MKEIMFVPGGTADKKKKVAGIIQRNRFIFSSNVFFPFVHLGDGGEGDNSNPTAKFKIQFMNSSLAF